MKIWRSHKTIHRWWMNIKPTPMKNDEFNSKIDLTSWRSYLLYSLCIYYSYTLLFLSWFMFSQNNFLSLNILYDYITLMLFVITLLYYFALKDTFSKKKSTILIFSLLKFIYQTRTLNSRKNIREPQKKNIQIRMNIKHYLGIFI